MRNLFSIHSRDNGVYPYLELHHTVMTGVKPALTPLLFQQWLVGFRCVSTSLTSSCLGIYAGNAVGLASIARCYFLAVIKRIKYPLKTHPGGRTENTIWINPDHTKWL